MMQNTDLIHYNVRQQLAFEDLKHSIEDKYGIKIIKIIPDDKSFLIYTSQAVYYLKRSDESENRVIFISGIYEYIKARGFENLLKLYDTLNGKYYFISIDGIYMLYDYQDSSKCGFSLIENGTEMIRFLADFHKASLGYIPPPGGKAKSNWGKWVEEYRKKMNCIKQLKKQIENNKERSPFELMALSSLDLYIERMEKCIDLLKKRGYLDNVEESMMRRQICAGSFRQYNFYKNSLGMNIKFLDKCCYDIWEKDIADLLSKFAESCPKKQLGKICDLLDEYNSLNALKENSVDIVRAFLIFPYEYVKIFLKYLKGKGDLTEGQFMDKLRCAMIIDNRRAEIAEMLN